MSCGWSLSILGFLILREKKCAFAKTSFSFISDPGGGSSLAEQMGVRFLGDIPIDPKIAQSMDSGLNLLQTQTSSHVTDVVDKMTESMSSLYD